MRLKVIIRRQHPGADQLFLECADVVQQVFRRAAADVVYGIGRQGEAVFPYGFFRRAAHDPQHALHDVVHIGKVALAVAIVKDRDRFSLHQLLGGGKIEHIGPPGRAVNRKESEPGAGNIVQLGVTMGQQFVALFCGGVKADGVVHFVIHAEGHLLVAAVNGGGGRIDQMFHRMMAAGLQNIVKPDQVAFDVHIGMVDGIAYARLSCQIDHHGGLEFLECFFYQRLIGNGTADEHVFDRRGFRGLFDQAQAVFLQLRVIVIVHVVQADHRAARHFPQQAQHQIRPDEARGSGHQDGFSVQVNCLFFHFCFPLFYQYQKTKPEETEDPSRCRSL